MVFEFNKLHFTDLDHRKFYYSTQIQEALKLEFYNALLDVQEIDNAVKSKFLELQKIKKINDFKIQNQNLENFYTKIQKNKALFLKIIELDTKLQDVIRRGRKSATNDIVDAYKKNSKNFKFNFAELLKRCERYKISAKILQNFLDNNFEVNISLSQHPTNPLSLKYTEIGNDFDRIIADKIGLNFQKLNNILKKIILCEIERKKKTCEEEMIESELAIKNILKAENKLLRGFKNIIEKSFYRGKIQVKRNFCNIASWSHGGDADGNEKNNATTLEIGVKRLKKFKVKIDIRHDSADIRNCVNNLLKDNDFENFESKNEEQKIDFLTQILSNKKLLDKISNQIGQNSQNNKIIKRLIIVAKNKKSFEKFIISNHKNVSDNLMVLLLLYVTKNQRNPINIVTLSESYEDLQSIFEVQKKLLSIKVYQQHLALCKKIIAMIAKSDTVRVSSIAVDYYQDRASGQLLMLKKIAKENYNLDLKLHIFSGGGNALQRGGGRHDELAYRVALAGINEAKNMKLNFLEFDPIFTTIQGQQQQIIFCNEEIAKNNLENFALSNLISALEIAGLCPHKSSFKNQNNNLRKKFSDITIKNYQQKYFGNKFFNELFYNANHIGVAVSNLSSRPLFRGSKQENIVAPIAKSFFYKDVKDFNIFNSRAITLDRTLAHSGTFALMFLGLLEAFEEFAKKNDEKIFLKIYRTNKSFQDFIRNQILALQMVDIFYAWKMLTGKPRPKASEIIKNANLFKELSQNSKFTLQERQFIVMCYLDLYIFNVAKFIAKSLFSQDLVLDLESYDLNKILEIYSDNLSYEMNYRKNEAIFSKKVESEIVNNINSYQEITLQEDDLKIFHLSYIANNIVFNTPLSLITTFTQFEKKSHHTENFLTKIQDKDLFF